MQCRNSWALFCTCRGLAIRFPLLAAITSAIIFLLILTLIIGLCIVPLVMRTTSQDTAEDETETNEALPTPDSQQTRGRESRLRRRSRSSRTASSERTVGTTKYNLVSLLTVFFLLQVHPNRCLNNFSNKASQTILKTCSSCQHFRNRNLALFLCMMDATTFYCKRKFVQLSIWFPRNFSLFPANFVSVHPPYRTQKK